MTNRARRTLGFAAALLGAAAFVVPAEALAATNPAQTGFARNTTSLSGVTSVAVNGSYAYATAYYSGQLVAVNISNPSSPSVAGASASASSLLNGTNIAISGGLAYVVSKNRNASTSNNDDGSGNSLTILSLANPASPTIVGSLKDANNLFGAYGIAVSGHYAYIAAQGCLSGQPCPNKSVGDSFAVVDVQNPASPTLVATIKNSALPSPWGGSNALKHPTSVAISGNYAYVTASYSDRLTVINIANPSSPSIVASLHDGTNLNFDVDVAVQGNYAYVADQASGLGRLAVVDISNPSNPTLAGTATSTTYMNGAYRVRVRGNFAYVSGVYSASIGAVDVSKPTAPRFAGGYASSSVLNRTTGLDLDSSGRYVFAVSPYSSSESNPTYPPFPGQVGGGTATGTVTGVDLDPVPITVTIASGSKPQNPTSQTTANFTFSTSDSVASVQCSLDNASFGSCTSATTATYSGLASGSHTFTVQATDAAGNTDTDSYTWTVSGGGGGGGGGTPPSTPVLDDFNRANGAAGSNWGTIAPSGFSAMKVVSNAAADNSTTQFAFDYWKPATFGPDSEAYYTIKSYGSSDVIRVGARVTGGTSSYSGYFVSVSAAGAWSIIRITGGSPTTLASGATQALASGDEVGIRVVGSVVTALHYDASAGAWSQMLTYDTSGDATKYSGAGSLALEFKTSTIDDFGGGTIGGGGGGGTPSPPTNTGVPAISGSTTVGSTLSTTNGTWANSPTSFSYQWQRCDSAGANCGNVGSNSSSYSLTASDQGDTIKVTVTATNSGGSGQATSALTGVVTAGGGGGGGGSGPSGGLLDDFNRANGGAGSNWTVVKSGSYATMNVSSNTAADSSSSQFAWNLWNPSTFTDGSAFVTISSYGASDTIRVGARVTGGSAYSGYFVSVTSSGAWSIIRIDNGGSPVTLKSGATQALAAGDKVGIQIVGTTITAWRWRGGTWTALLTYDTAGDATRYSSGSLALEFKTSRLDDFSGG